MEELPPILEEARLRRGVVALAYSEDPAGVVTAQTPEAGQRVGQGTAVNVIVSRGQGTVTVPNVTGITEKAGRQERGDKRERSLNTGR